ncbi:MAG: hypothetical protein E6H92_07460 [Chloroflexi bacterium]|nr:MAG: hypothetical protein E6H92_07460 [Chloroflexota bacterium]
MTHRFLIRYSIQRWEDGKWFYGIFLVVLCGLIAIKLVLHQPVTFLWWYVLGVDVILLVSLYLFRLTSYLETGPDGLSIHYMFRRARLPYEALTKVRKQPLDVAFQPADRRRYVNRFVRRLSREPAVYIRIDKRQPDLIAQTERRLGQRLVAGPDVVLPITDIDTFIGEMKGRLRG